MVYPNTPHFDLKSPMDLTFLVALLKHCECFEVVEAVTNFHRLRGKRRPGVPSDMKECKRQDLVKRDEMLSELDKFGTRKAR